MVREKMVRPGLYRIKNGWKPDEDSAVLGSDGDGGLTVEIAEHDYRELGYQPAFDDLPWKAVFGTVYKPPR